MTGYTEEERLEYSTCISLLSTLELSDPAFEIYGKRLKCVLMFNDWNTILTSDVMFSSEEKRKYLQELKWELMQ